jgi:hypothetical protein
MFKKNGATPKVLEPTILFDYDLDDQRTISCILTRFGLNQYLTIWHALLSNISHYLDLYFWGAFVS